MKKHLFGLITVAALMVPRVCEAQRDKLMHAGAGFGITISVAAVTHRPKLALLTGVGAGAAKEIWDSQHVGHTASARDAIATAAASTAAYALYRYVFMKKPPVKIATVDTPGATTSLAVTPKASPVNAVTAAETPAPTATSGPVVSAVPGGGSD